MNVFVYVEGQADRVVLEQLFKPYRPADARVDFVGLGGKARLFAKLGKLAVSNLQAEADCRVIAMPDLHPMREFDGTPYQHNDWEGLVARLRGIVADHAREQGLRPDSVDELLARFDAYPFSYDMEVLLLAAPGELERHLGGKVNVRRAFHARPEEQNDQDYPKKVVNDLFLRARKTRYKDVTDAPRVLRNVSLGQLRDPQTLPHFCAFLRQIEEITGVSTQ